MRINFLTLFAICLNAVLTLSTSQAKELSELKVLYIGSERTAAYVAFLKKNVGQVESKNRKDFKPADAAPFDVVLLDWPQGEETREMRKLKSPLGDREEWNKPTVLLGSAGLNLAVSWKLKGGVGCTCMDPLAYNLLNHEIFNQPLKTDRTKMIHIPTPPDFRGEIKNPEVEVLPLVRDIKKSHFPGWCSYTGDFTNNPDVEVFCGGVNHKTPTAAGFWRQGNLLHYGFDLSPAEMNEEGQKLLLNSIAYISRFTEDRPIAITRSVFAGTVPSTRSGMASTLRRHPDWAKNDLSPETWSLLSSMSQDAKTEWAEKNTKFLHPNANNQLEIDKDLEVLGVPFDKPEFFEKAIANLRAGGTDAESAKRLLARYVPIGPVDGTAEQWSSWWKENQPYAFPSDSTEYRWYLDVLAKKRGVPSKELRGIHRADVLVSTASK
jgi:hypothetical protein